MRIDALWHDNMMVSEPMHIIDVDHGKQGELVVQETAQAVEHSAQGKIVPCEGAHSLR
jgi:hypothetical protein